MFKFIFMKKNDCIFIQLSLNYVNDDKRWNDNKSALVVTAWRQMRQTITWTNGQL